MIDNINFQTSHNVAIEYRVASLYDRILASLIDVTILFVYSIIISIVFIFGFGFASNAGYYLLFLPVLFYDLIFESLLQGSSIGKKIMKIRVVSTDGTEAGFIQYFLRWIIRPIDIWLTTGGVATLTVLLNGKGQRLGDIAAGSCVISSKSIINLNDTIFETLDENYQPEFTGVVNLNDKDISTINDLLKANSMPEVPENVVNATYRAKELIQSKINSTSDKHPIDFLKKVIRDYNFYSN